MPSVSDKIMKALISNRVVGFRYELLDKGDHVIGEVNASGSIANDNTTSIARTASLSIKEQKDIDIVNERIKPFFRLKVDGEFVEFPLGIYLINANASTYDSYSHSKPLECYDKTVILREDKFTSRRFIAEGTYYTTAVMQILSSAGIVKSNIPASMAVLSHDYEYDIGVSKLDAINELLTCINYEKIHFDNNGVACSQPFIEYPSRASDYIYSADKDSVIELPIEKSVDTFNFPNKIVRYVQNPEDGASLISVWENTNVASKLSIASRGRNIVDIESVSDIADQTTLNNLVRRIAYEKQVYEVVKWNSCILPTHDYANMYGLEIPQDGISGKYFEYRWEMNLEVGGTMKHYCKKVIQI